MLTGSKRCVYLLVFAVVLLCSSNASSQLTLQSHDLTNAFYRAYPLAMGGAFRAITGGSEATLVNPAGLSLQRKTGLNFNYSVSGYLDSRILSGSFFDSKQIALATGFTFDRNDMIIEGRSVSATQIILGLSKSYKKVVYMGSNIKYIHIGRDIVSGGNQNHLTTDAGVIVKPISNLYFATVMKNLFSGRKYPEIPLIWSWGSGVDISGVAKLCFDFDIDLSTENSSRVNYYFGGELMLSKDVFFRTGFALDRVRDNPFYSVGLGFAGSRLGLSFSFAQRVDPLIQTYAMTVQLAI